MDTAPLPEPFTVDDFDALAELVIASWVAGADLDWGVPAGTLEWTCLFTADHTIDCVFSYALFLGSRKTDWYPNFGELHANEGAGATDMVDGLRAVCNMLSATIRCTPPDVRAVIWLKPSVATGAPQDFASRGALELILHAQDVASGLGVRLEPPQDLCRRLWNATRTRTHNGSADATDHATDHPTDDAWVDLLVRSGRPAPIR